MLPFYEKALEKMKKGTKLTMDESKAIAEEFEKFARAYEQIIIAVPNYNEGKLIDICTNLYFDICISGGGKKCD